LWAELDINGSQGSRRPGILFIRTPIERRKTPGGSAFISLPVQCIYMTATYMKYAWQDSLMPMVITRNLKGNILYYLFEKHGKSISDYYLM